MNYIYNGVELPALPGYDTAAYPYAVIAQGGSITTLYVSSKPLYYLWPIDVAYGYCSIDPFDRGSTSLKNGSWEEFTFDAVTSATETESGTECYWCFGILKGIWANHDILKEDGTVYLAASEPIPVSTWKPDPISMVLGWLVGRRLAGQRGKVLEPVEPDEPSGEIVGYLYNGVQLPDINTVWTDKETYPYAYIATSGYDEMPYALQLVNKQAALVENGGTKLVEVSAPYSVSIYVVDTSMSNWIHADTATEAEGSLVIAGTEGSMRVVWTSHDLLDTDGSIYLAASEPVPVYA